MTRMNFDRAKKTRPHLGRGASPRSVERMERRADELLDGAPRRHDPEKPERSYYRSVGSVLFYNGRWWALDGGGQPIGDHSTRWMAWRQADKLGVIRAGMV